MHVTQDRGSRDEAQLPLCARDAPPAPAALTPWQLPHAQLMDLTSAPQTARPGRAPSPSEA